MCLCGLACVVGFDYNEDNDPGEQTSGNHCFFSLRPRINQLQQASILNLSCKPRQLYSEASCPTKYSPQRRDAFPGRAIFLWWGRVCLDCQSGADTLM